MRDHSGEKLLTTPEFFCISTNNAPAYSLLAPTCPWSILKREKIEITAQKGLSKDVWEDKEKSGMFEEIEKTWVF